MNTFVLVAKMCKDVKLHRFARAVNVSKELLLLTFPLGCKIDQRLKNEQIYYVGHFTIITHIYFDFSGCRKVDQCFTITHVLMFQELFNLRLLLMISTARSRM